MPAIRPDVSRIYLQNKSGNKRRLLNIIGIRSEDGTPFEYKITFEGLKIEGNWVYVEKGVLDAINGIQSFKNKRKVEGTLSIGYHKDGNVMYKIGERNFKPYKHAPINKLGKAVLFLRIAGFSLDELANGGNQNKENSSIITLLNYSDKTPIVCDLYISTGPTDLNFILPKESLFKDTESISLHDEKEKVSLHFHFYKAAAKGVHIAIVKGGFWARLARAKLYYWLLVKRWFAKKLQKSK